MSKEYLLSVRRPSQEKRPSVFCLLLSVLVLLSALWSVQVMSSALFRVCADRQKASGNRARAEQLYQISETMDPQNWRAPLGIGQILSYHRYYELDPAEKIKRAQRERDTFARAFHHNPKKEEAVYGLGRAELALGNRDAGLEKLRQAAQYKRFNDFYWRKLGIELRKAGRYEESWDAFLHARKLDRRNPTVKYNMKWLKKRMGDK